MAYSAGNRMRTRWNPNNVPDLVRIENGAILQAFETNDVDKVSSTLLYNGLEDKNGVWVIEKVDSTSGVSLRYATHANNSSYNDYLTAWANRATLTYNIFSIAF
jgi:hypothetical protein